MHNSQHNLEIIEDIQELNSDDWDRLCSLNDPFISHAFLSSLEQSHSVGRSTGWLPLHIAIKDQEGLLIAALPLYLKNHSYGEYIFDWSWADASERAGITYYPKLVSAIPFTPASGDRMLLSQPDNTELVDALWQGCRSIMEATKASSIHLLFTPESHQAQLCPKGFIARQSSQFHWNNSGLESFDHWLSLFKSKARKNIRAERRRAQANVDKIYWLTGAELTSKHCETIWTFYINTTNRKRGQPYLTREFFAQLNQGLADLTFVCFAEKDGEIVASSLCFQKGKHLYGRYWGCKETIDFLHFELCYHQPIELCIQKGWTKFEAGAQGDHKLKRGLLPNKTHSLHWLRHQGLHGAIDDFCKQEASDIDRQLQALALHSPLKPSSPT